MPSFTDGLYEIRLRQTFLGQNVVNLFYYRDIDTGDPITIDQVSARFLADVVDEIVKMQHNSIEGIDIRTRKVGGLNENILPIPLIDGIRPGPPLNSFTAYGFRLHRSNIDVRNGSKRFAGVSEDDVSGNGVDSIVTDIADEVAFALGEPLVLASGATLEPVVYRRGSFDEPNWIGTNVNTVSFTGLTSQVSRKARPG